ncbi:MAG: hypothetical protein U9R29_08365 [Thermodesulfobacteriota bacterium]|nr:hypothetical protein [Thermodesulfobacteriota bacterium]
MSHRLIVLIPLVISLFFSGCSLIPPKYKVPSVNVTAFKALPTQGLAPRFEIELHIINSNRNPLVVDEIYYTIEIEGHRILEGIANKYPTIAAYSEGNIVLGATANIVNSLRLIADLSQQPRNTFNYKLKAKLDVGILRPSIRIVKEGEISLMALTR